jgi:hypothetical protein
MLILVDVAANVDVVEQLAAALEGCYYTVSSVSDNAVWPRSAALHAGHSMQHTQTHMSWPRSAALNAQATVRSTRASTQSPLQHGHVLQHCT